MNHREMFLRYLAQTSDAPMMVEAVKARGIYIETASGEQLIDGISGISVSNLGHLHPAVAESVKQQLSLYDHLMVYGEYVLSPQVRLAKLLADILPSSLQVTYFLNSGSEAIDAAMKLAKRYTGRYEIISFSGAYHGSTHAAMSLMSDEDYKRNFRPLLPCIHHLPYNDIEALMAITDKTAAVVFEYVQAEAGVVAGREDFLGALFARCRETGTLLIADEIQTGVGRTGKMFAFQHSGLIPDILVLGKAFGFGLPLSAVVSSEKIMQVLTHNPVLGHITTFGGHPVCCAASLAGMRYLLENPSLIASVEKKALLFLEHLQRELFVEIRHVGLMFALECETEEYNRALLHQCLTNGLIADWFLFHSRSLRFCPPLIISEQEIVRCAEIINRSAREVNKK